MKIISRKDAKAKGLKHYFTGKSCVNGHTSERFTCNYECIECDAIRKGRKVEAVKEVKKIKKVRVVQFKVIGRDRRYMGKEKFNSTIIDDRVVAVG